MAEKAQDRILIVESDPVISDIIARQALKAAGYQTIVVPDAGTAIARTIQAAPDVIIANLSLPGLSAKDLMVALNSQNIEVPVVVLASQGGEAAIIQAFRLGAADYLLWPVREAEIVNVVERVLKQVRERRERERLSRQLQQTNQELQMRVRELTTIFSIGKAVISITNQSLLFDKILEGALKVSQADLGWLLLRQDERSPFILSAQKNLPASLPVRIGQSWDDSISSLVAMSGEPLAIHGEPVKRFKIASLGQSALVVPLRIQKLVVGLLVLMRKQPAPFTPSEQRLVEAVVDYASISLVNARLFRAVENQVQNLQTAVSGAGLGQKIAAELLQTVQTELRGPLDAAWKDFERLVKDPAARWSAGQRQILTNLQAQLQYQRRIVESIPGLPTVPAATGSPQASLNETIKKVSGEFQHYAQGGEVTLVAETPPENIVVCAGPDHLRQVVEGLLSNAIKHSNPGGRVTIRLEKTGGQQAHVTVSDNGAGIDPHQQNKIFEGKKQAGQTAANLPGRFGGLSIGLGLIKEVITHYNGKVWVESQPGKGTSFHFTLPLGNQ